MIQVILHKNTMNPTKSLLIVFILACICTSYTLDGQWNLTPQQL